ncbi:hypothetical protein BVX97_02785 [bacterium E08(2017)]|nr:hypothetical protein BVX97_02785 [bacterium E08(2017)]
MKYLVTGSAGFIGFHVSKTLLDQGHTVVGIDNFNDYYDPSLKRDRNATLNDIPNYSCTEGEIADLDTISALFETHEFDAVCHLAAQAGVRYSLTNPHVYQKANLEAFLNILECCRHNDIERLVYASSSSVYGGNTKLPFSETDNVDTPISLYAATKKANELMAHTYSHLYGLQTVGLRFFTVYGPWGRPDMAMWLFTEAMLKGQPIKVFNHGDMRRDFTYVDDIVSGVIASMTVPGLDKYEVFNLGNHRSENLMDLINIIGSELDIKPEMEMLPMQPGDVPATYANTELANKKLGFDPKTPISEGVPQFINWYREYKDI